MARREREIRWLFSLSRSENKGVVCGNRTLLTNTKVWSKENVHERRQIFNSTQSSVGCLRCVSFETLNRKARK